MSVANGVWIDRSMPFKPSFKKVVDEVYKAASETVDFQNKVSLRLPVKSVGGLKRRLMVRDSFPRHSEQYDKAHISEWTIL